MVSEYALDPPGNRYQEMGFETVIVRMPGPYDRETIDRMAEVQERLGT